MPQLASEMPGWKERLSKAVSRGRQRRADCGRGNGADVMKAQEVILKATAGKLKWWEAAEIMGM